MTDLNYALNTGSAPVLFDVHSAAEFRQVEPICKNITGQKVLNQVITNAFSLSKDFVWDATGNFGAVGYSIDSYGFLVNRVLLEKAGYHFSDLKDLASLSDIAADIQSRAGELGIASAFSAVNSTEFCSNLYNACAFPTLESSGYAEPQFLEEVPGKMQGLMDVVSSNGPGLSSYNDLSSFIQGRTVFCPAEVNDYSTEMENAIGYENVGFIPLYCGNGDEEKQGLCTNANRFWCEYLEEGPKFYYDDMITDQPEKQIAAEIIREKLLWCLDKEVPHGIAIEIERMQEKKNITSINAVIYCEKASHKGIVISKHGEMLKKVGTMARADIEKMLGKKVYLELWVRVKNDWRNNNYLMKNFGFTSGDEL